MTQPFVWGAVTREHFVEDSQAMRRRVESYVPAAEARPADQARASAACATSSSRSSSSSSCTGVPTSRSAAPAP